VLSACEGPTPNGDLDLRVCREPGRMARETNAPPQGRNA
jgi:hypothetical protein